MVDSESESIKLSPAQRRSLQRALRQGDEGMLQLNQQISFLEEVLARGAQQDEAVARLSTVETIVEERGVPIAATAGNRGIAPAGLDQNPAHSVGGRSSGCGRHNPWVPHAW